MSLTIADTRITSDVTGAYAEFRPHAAADGHGAWVMIYADVLDPVPAYYGRLLDRNQAITAMTIAEEQVKPHPNAALIRTLESEL